MLNRFLGPFDGVDDFTLSIGGGPLGETFGPPPDPRAGAPAAGSNGRER